MNLLKRDYFPVSKDLNQFLENFLKGQTDSSFIDTGTWAPAVDIKEEKNQFVVTADIPGVDVSDINVSLENSILTIQGKREFEKKENRDEYSRIERIQGQFYRRFSLPQSVEESKIDASYKNGVLQIIIPKKEIAKGMRIEVRGES
ncbi:MAG: Hsp20/alpha crystallin family protein [Gammaproteobacteria bacterium]